MGVTYSFLRFVFNVLKTSNICIPPIHNCFSSVFKSLTIWGNVCLCTIDFKDLFIFFYFGYEFFFFLFFFGWMACIIIAPWKGISESPLQWKCGILTTGSPGSPPFLIFFINNIHLFLYHLFFFKNPLSSSELTWCLGEKISWPYMCEYTSELLGSIDLSVSPCVCNSVWFSSVFSIALAL